MRLIFRPAARDDLRAIYRFIASDNPAAARRFTLEIRRRCGMLREQPQAGVARDDLSPGIRILTMLRSVVVAYRITSGGVRIARIFYAGQDYNTALRTQPNE